MHFLLVINSNFNRVSYRFRDIVEFCLKMFSHPSHCLSPRSRGTPTIQRNLYIAEKYI